MNQDDIDTLMFDLDSIYTSDGVYNIKDSALDNSITIGNSNSFWSIGDITIDQPPKGTISIDGELVDARLVKKLKLLLDTLSTDERFKDIMADIDTQLAFEELSKDNED